MNVPITLSGPAGLVFDVERRGAMVNGTAVELSAREVDLLEVLLAERGRVVPYDELALRVWGFQPTGDQRFIYTAAWRLRRALAAAGAPHLVEGVRGVGYLIAHEETYRSPDFRAVAVFDPEDPEWRLSFVNEDAVELSGYSAEALTTTPGTAMNLWHPNDRVVLDEATAYALTTAPVTLTGCRLIRADGEIVAVDIVVSRLDLPGQPPQALAVVTPAEGR